MLLWKGGKRLSLSAFAQLPPSPMEPGGGFGNAIVGSFFMVGVATLLTVPIGILTAVYLARGEGGRVAGLVRFAAKVLTGFPSILAGVFAYGAVVLLTGSFSAVAGAIALSILMVPTIILTAEDALRAVLAGAGRARPHAGEEPPAIGGTTTLSATDADGAAVIDCNIRELFYGAFRAVRDTRIQVMKNAITAFIGPSGCGKSTVLRCLNRMNDLVRGFRFEGHVRFGGHDIYHHSVDPVAVRRFIGMAFQQPNPSATSIYNNVAFGLRLNGYKGDHAPRVEAALRRAALWDEVKDKLNKSGLSLSGGPQQRLCIARAIATEPQVLLMDEPCSALDPVATRRIEELMLELKSRYTIAIVTHNLQQAKRVADHAGFMYVDTAGGDRTGYLVEFGPSQQLFEAPHHPHTQKYVRVEFS
jgi:phosphate transport system ATP-binding protein